MVWTVLLMTRGDDVGAARAAARKEHKCQTQTLHAAPDYTGHEFLVAYAAEQCAIGLRDDVLQETYAQAHQRCGHNSTNKIASAHDAQGKHQQRTVDEEIAVLCLEARGIVYQSGYTAHTATGNLVGQQKERIADAIDSQAQQHFAIVLQKGQFSFLHRLEHLIHSYRKNALLPVAGEGLIHVLMGLKPLPYTPSTLLCDTKAEGSVS